MRRFSSPSFFLLVFGACLALGAPAFANGSMISVSSTQSQVSFQHPGYKAQGSGGFSGLPYKVCWQEDTELWGWGCDFTDKTTYRINYLTVGKRYRVKVMCHCRGSGRWAIARDIKIAELLYTHSEPPPVTPTPGPKLVRLRDGHGGLCLYRDSVGLLLSGACSTAPHFTFAVEPAPGGGMQVRHLDSGACIWGWYPNSPGVLTAPCGTVGTMVYIQPVTAGASWINIPVTQVGQSPKGPGGCLVAGNAASSFQVSKRQCEALNLSERFYLDPV